MEYTPTRMQIKFTPEESRLLAKVAREQHRDPRAQAAFFIRQALGLNGVEQIITDIVAVVRARQARVLTAAEALERLAVLIERESEEAV